MRTLGFRTALAGCALTASFAACSGASQQPIPATPAQTTDSSLAALTRARQGTSSINPDSTNQDLLYVSNQSSGTVGVYSYRTGTLVQTLTGLTEPSGECVDKTGDVFIANMGDGSGFIAEYAHGGMRPIQTLADSRSFAHGCAIDPVTDDLAVANYAGENGKPGEVFIYKGATGQGKGPYYASNIYRCEFAAYDDAGNLFIDGYSKPGNFAAAEMRKGSKSFEPLTLNATISSPGGMQRIGRRLAIGDADAGVIDVFKISGSNGALTGSTTLTMGAAYGFTIIGSKVVAQGSDLNQIGFWSFPAGGSPIKTIGGFSEPFGTALSLAK